MLNNQIFFFFYGLAHRNPFLDKVIVFFAQTFPYIVILLAIVFLLFHHEILSFNKKSFEQKILALETKWREIVLVFFSGVFAWCVAYALKKIIQSPRPFNFLPKVIALLSEKDFSFPSGHATFYMALAVAIFLNHKKAGYIFIFCALLIGIARIAAGVHFPIDILGGYILGAGIAYLVKFLYVKFQKYNPS